jgi:1-phosphofructokinase
MTDALAYDVVTVTLNPAIDQTLTISNFVAGEVHRVENVTYVAGGKGVNVAAAIADYGLRVAATGFLGRDNTTLFTQLFTRKNIHDLFVRLDGVTRTGIKIADGARGLTTDINFPGLTITLHDLDVLETALLKMNAPWLVLAGSLPPKVDASFYSRLTAKLRARGTCVAFDSSGQALKTLVAGEADALPHLIKPNIAELEDPLNITLPTRKDVLQAARSLVARGIETVIVSMGADGALFVTQHDAVFAAGHATNVVSTVGAGDAMVAGFVASQLQKLPLEPSARLATAFALDALRSLEAGISSPNNIEALAADVVTSLEF